MLAPGRKLYRGSTGVLRSASCNDGAKAMRSRKNNWLEGQNAKTAPPKRLPWLTVLCRSAQTHLAGVRLPPVTSTAARYVGMPAQTKPRLDVIAVIPIARMAVLRSDDCQENRVASEREDGFHASPSRIVYQECQHNRWDLGFKEGLAQRSGLGDANASCGSPTRQLPVPRTGCVGRPNASSVATPPTSASPSPRSAIPTTRTLALSPTSRSPNVYSVGAHLAF